MSFRPQWNENKNQKQKEIHKIYTLQKLSNIHQKRQWVKEKPQGKLKNALGWM